MHDLGEIAQNYTRLIQQVDNQQEALTEIQIGLSLQCRAGLVVRHNGLFILYVIDHNCLILISLDLINMQKPPKLPLIFSKHLPAVIIQWHHSGFMITVIPHLLLS